MARKKYRRRRRSGYQRVVKKGTKCPTSVRRECKVTKKGGQRCRVIAGSYKSGYTTAGQALRSSIKLRERLKKKGCTVSTPMLGRYRR